MGGKIGLESREGIYLSSIGVEEYEKLNIVMQALGPGFGSI